MTLVDTSFIIDLMENDIDAVGKLNQLEHQMMPIFASTPTIFELWTGIVLSKKREDEKQQVIDVLRSIATLSLDIESAKTAGKINGELIKQGKMIDAEDCMIAGIAKTHNETILTRNVAHFGRIKGIKIETY